MHIRLSRTDDVPRILEIFEIAKQYMRAQGNLKQWGDGYPSSEVILRDISKGWSHVIENREGRVVATFCLMLSPEPTYCSIDGAWLDDSTPYGTIHRIASDGSQSGIFSLALNYCQSIVGNIRIDTHKDNQAMQKAVLREGFSRCGIIQLADGSLRTAYQKLMK